MHVHHHMNIGQTISIFSDIAKGDCQAACIGILPVGLFELGTMPANLRNAISVLLVCSKELALKVKDIILALLHQ
jgi:hypothetical protein